jgi:hypothetical protein
MVFVEHSARERLAQTLQNLPQPTTGVRLVKYTETPGTLNWAGDDRRCRRIVGLRSRLKIVKSGEILFGSENPFSICP